MKFACVTRAEVSLRQDSADGRPCALAFYVCPAGSLHPPAPPVPLLSILPSHLRTFASSPLPILAPGAPPPPPPHLPQPRGTPLTPSPSPRPRARSSPSSSPSTSARRARQCTLAHGRGGCRRRIRPPTEVEAG
jgi:hypothetical protein